MTFSPQRYFEVSLEPQKLLSSKLYWGKLSLQSQQNTTYNDESIEGMEVIFKYAQCNTHNYTRRVRSV